MPNARTKLVVMSANKLSRQNFSISQNTENHK